MIQFETRGTNLVMTRVTKEGKGKGDYYLYSTSMTREMRRLEKLIEGDVFSYHGFCQCGCEWLTISREDLDRYYAPLAIGCPSCGCTNEKGREIFETLGVRVYDDPHKVAISGFIMHRKIRHKTVRVETEENYWNRDYYEPSHVFPERTQFRITYNRNTRRAYLVTQVGRRPRQVKSLFSEKPQVMDSLDYSVSRLDDGTLREFGEKLLAELPEYIVREYRLRRLLFPEIRETDYREYATTLIKTFLLLARPYTQYGDGLFLYSPFASEQRRLAASKGRKELYRTLFPAATNRNMSLFRSLIHAGEGRVMAVFMLLENPEVFHNCCQALIEENNKNPWSPMIPQPHSDAKLLAYRPDISPSIREGFVKDMFGTAEQLHQRLIDVQYEVRAMSYLADALHLYARCRHAAKVKTVRDYLPTAGTQTIREVHDLLSVVQRKIGEKKITFQYPASLREGLEGVRGAIDFRLAASNHELFEVGEYMRNCIGGYTDSIRQGNELIITGYLGDTPYVCIGYVPDKKTVFEVKARFNQRFLKDDPHMVSILDYLSAITSDVRGIRDLHQVFAEDLVKEKVPDYQAVPF